ncbi:MAG: RagB/SusD family nutrient uptake outer membrane protein [Bacteroidota bacterium]
MKRIIFIFILGVFIATSCNKQLDTVPTGQLTPATGYGSAKQIAAALSGMYNNLRQSSMYSKNYTSQMMVGTDETYYYNTNYGYTTYSYISPAPNDGDITAFWKACYQSINYCNTFLDNVDASATSVDPNVVRRAKGEALFLRGYYYFMLAQWFGDVPLSLHATTDPLQGQTARTPLQAVYDQIITDMTTAEGMLQDQTYASLGYSEKVSVTAVEGMLARVCLYAAGAPLNDTKRYADAKAWALKVVNSGQHALQPNFQNVFMAEMQDTYNTENMWEIGFNVMSSGTSAGGQFSVFTGISNSQIATGASTVYYGYDYGYVKSQARLYCSYEPGDLRRDWTLGNYTWTITGNNTAAAVSIKTYFQPAQIWSRNPGKWRREYEIPLSLAQQTISCTNFPVLRYSDVLLMLAEAENELNGPTSIAYNAINQVRARAYSATPMLNSFNVTSIGSGYTSTSTAPTTVTLTGGGGAGAAAVCYPSAVAKSISQIIVTNPGSGYSSAPTVTVGVSWAAGVAYAVNAQVINSGKLYTVTTAGTSTATGPTQTSGASTAATTGAVFTYAGIPATATASITTATSATSALSGLSKDAFRAALQKERYLELAFESLRKPDLKRWGVLVPTVQSLATDLNGTTGPQYFTPIPAYTTEFTDASIPTAPVQGIGNKDLLWPIPAYDLQYNFLLKQNPGY